MKEAGFPLNVFYVMGKGFCLWFIILTIWNLLSMGFIILYGKKKKFGPVVFFIILLLIPNIIFVVRQKNILDQRVREISGFSTEAPVDAGPHPRTYDFIKKHTLVRDRAKGLISAVDSISFSVPLCRAAPRQAFQDSFYIMMDKEGRTFKTDGEKLDYAKFIILIFYGESAPIYAENRVKLIENLKGRPDPRIRKIGENMEEALKKNNSSPRDPQIPHGDEWDLDGHRFNFENPELGNLLKRIGPPEFEERYDGSTVFRLYTFSLRYRELVEWQFMIYPTGEVWIKRLNTVTD